MTTTIRSQALLRGSTLAPITVVIVQGMHSKTEAAEVREGHLLTYHPGLSFKAVLPFGMLCFLGACISLLADFIPEPLGRYVS